MARYHHIASFRLLLLASILYNIDVCIYIHTYIKNKLKEENASSRCSPLHLQQYPSGIKQNKKKKEERDTLGKYTKTT